MIRTGPSTYKHRAEFAKMPSVVSWNTRNLNRKPEIADTENDAGVASTEGESGRSKKRRDVVAGHLSCGDARYPELDRLTKGKADPALGFLFSGG